MILRVLIAIVILAAAAFTVRLWMEGKRSHTMSPDLGLVDGKLRPCPDKPNCVCTFTDPSDEKHHMEALQISGNVLEKVELACKSLGLKMVQTDGNYARYEYKSKLFGFVDDIEFLYDEGAGLLHFRSASRVGYSDMGANRKRMQSLLAELQR